MVDIVCFGLIVVHQPSSRSLTIPSLPDLISPSTLTAASGSQTSLASPPSLAARRRRDSPGHLTIPEKHRSTLVEVDGSIRDSSTGHSRVTSYAAEVSPMPSDEAEHAQVTTASKAFLTASAACQLLQRLQLISDPADRTDHQRKPAALRVITEGSPMEQLMHRPRNGSIASFESEATSKQFDLASERLVTPSSVSATHPNSIAIRKAWRSPQATVSAEDLFSRVVPPSSLRSRSGNTPVEPHIPKLLKRSPNSRTRNRQPQTPPLDARSGIDFASPWTAVSVGTVARGATEHGTPPQGSAQIVKTSSSQSSPSDGVAHRKGLLDAYDPTPSYDLPPLTYQLGTPPGPNVSEAAIDMLLKAADCLDATPRMLSQADMISLGEEKRALTIKLEALERQHAAGARRRRRALICLSVLIQDRDVSHSHKVLRCLAKLGEDLDGVARDTGVTAKSIARLSELETRQAAALLQSQRMASRSGNEARRGRIFASGIEQTPQWDKMQLDVTLVSPQVIEPTTAEWPAPPVVTLSRLQSLRTGHRGQRASYRDSVYSQCSISDLARYSFPMPPLTLDQSSSDDAITTIRHPRGRSNSVDVLIFPPDSQYALLAPPSPHYDGMLPSSPMSPDYRPQFKRHVRFASSATPGEMDRQDVPVHDSTPPTSFILRTGRRPQSLPVPTSRSNPASPRRDRTSNFDDVSDESER